MKVLQKYLHMPHVFSIQPTYKLPYHLVLCNITVYHCGSDQGWSDMFWFITSPDESTWSPQLAIFGDLGNENAKSLPHLQEEVQRGMYDAILHVGDFAYDMDSVRKILFLYFD